MSELASPTLTEFMQQCSERAESLLADKLSSPAYPARLQQAMAYATLGGGKRIRPVLVWAANLAVGGQQSDADNAACAVELIHCYSLAHDDLPAMDDDDLRRGKPSLHRAFDDATAILVGDALQARAFECLSERQSGLGADQQVAMLRCLSEAVGAAGMVGGQMLDFSGMGHKLSQPELEQLHRMKTGALIKASVLLGAMACPDTTPEQLEALNIYADAIGLAFQVQDDILDETSDTATLGKPQGSDSLLAKPTYVSILGLERARQLATELTDAAQNALVNFSNTAQHLRDLAVFLERRSH
jgi:geranylgeranyl diphosphate synthase type II